MLFATIVCARLAMAARPACTAPAIIAGAVAAAAYAALLAMADPFGSHVVQQECWAYWTLAFGATISLVGSTAYAFVMAHFLPSHKSGGVYSPIPTSIRSNV